MREEDVSSVLNKLRKGQLQGLTHQLGFDFQSRLTQDYVDFLSGIDWNEERLSILETFYIQQLLNRSSYDVSLYFLPAEYNFNEIRDNLNVETIDDLNMIYDNQRTDGFQLNINNDNIISGNYYFATDKIIPDLVRREISNVRILNVIRFEVNNQERCVKIFDNLPAHYTKFHKSFRETTEIELLIRGLHNHYNDSMDRVNNFLGNYNVRDAENIILFFPQTLRERVHKITYDGINIFNDRDVQNYINNDHAVVVGFTVQIEYQGFNFRVKIGSNNNMAYISVKSSLNEARALAEDLEENYRNHFL